MQEDQIRIRPYRGEDFQRLQEIHDPARKKELELAGLQDAFLPLSIAAEREDLFSYTLAVAEYRGRAAGFVAYTQEEIAWLYVDTALTRRGIGRTLLQYALRHTRENVSIEVLAGNVPALGLYQSAGFQITETLSGVMPGNESFPVTVHVLQRIHPRE